MLDARNRFREGYIMLLRPFQFVELKNPIQKLTILWAYAEQPVTKKVLTTEAHEKAAEVENTQPFFLNKDAADEWLNRELGKIFDKPESYDMLYEGEIVQAYVEGQMCRFYPEEYKILSKELIFEYMQEEGYHAILKPELLAMKEFKDKVHYLQSRGVPKRKAEKWASLSFGPLVMYKPYYQLLEQFAREYEIYPDAFYEEVEGIVFEKK